MGICRFRSILFHALSLLDSISDILSLTISFLYFTQIDVFVLDKICQANPNSVIIRMGYYLFVTFLFQILWTLIFLVFYLLLFSIQICEQKLLSSIKFCVNLSLDVRYSFKFVLKRSDLAHLKVKQKNTDYNFICITQSKLIGMKAEKNESVKVGLRVRPLNQRQTKLNSPVCVQSKDNVLLIKKGPQAKEFVFDYVFGMHQCQKDIYESCAYSIVENALEGYNGTIFAYGQTGAGKTFTMVGNYKDSELKGIIPRGFEHVINAVQTSEDKRYVVRASFVQIYNEDIFDLLDDKGDTKKEIKQSPQTGIFIKDLKCIPVKSVEELFKTLAYGDKNRSVAKTAMNATSSRSHALFTIHIESLEGADKVKGSKLNFVDLAGSERAIKTGASGATLKEGAKINLSLTALGNVINALVEGKKGGHIPYRDSKLTRLLQDSLGGNTKTLMIASVSPAEDNYDETVSTLRYAARARNIKNTPKVNEDPKDTMIRQYLQQIEKLKKQLASGGIIEGNQTSEEIVKEYEERANKKQQQLSQKETEIYEMKLKLKEMEELIIKKDKQTPETVEKTKKRRMEKKKIMKNEELNQNRVAELQEQDKKQLQQTQNQDKNADPAYWKSIAKKLRRKLKNAVTDKADLAVEFEDERETLNQTIRRTESELSFFRQIAQKFLPKEDIAMLRQHSIFNEEKREYVLPGFLLHDEKLTLPKTLKKNQIEDLWQQKRKGYKLQFVQTLPEVKGVTDTIEESKSVYIQKSKKQNESPNKTENPFLRNRRIFKGFNPDDQRYKQKEYDLNSPGVTFYRRNFRINDSSKDSKDHQRPKSRTPSNAKLAPLALRPEVSTEEKRPLSKGKQKLEPIVRKN